MAYEEDSSNSNGQRVLHQEYQVNFRPRTLQVDVKIEIFHDGVTITVLEMIAGVAEVQQAFAKSLSANHVNSKTCAQKGDYIYYGTCAKNAKENTAEMYGRKSRRKSSSTNGSTSLQQTRTFGLSDAIIATLKLARRIRHGFCGRSQNGVVRWRTLHTQNGVVRWQVRWGHPKTYFGSRVLAVCSVDRTGGAAVMNLSKVSC